MPVKPEADHSPSRLLAFFVLAVFFAFASASFALLGLFLHPLFFLFALACTVFGASFAFFLRRPPIFLALVAINVVSVVVFVGAFGAFLASARVSRLGDIEVRVEDARAERVMLESTGIELRRGTKYRSDEPCLVIHLAVFNASETRRHIYHSWGTRQHDPLLRGRLLDQHGNHYRALSFGLDANVHGQWPAGTPLEPGGFLRDVLVFEPPPPGAKLRLFLPGATVGQHGEFFLDVALSDTD